jgi:hypothetical protein
VVLPYFPNHPRSNGNFASRLRSTGLLFEFD